MKRETLRHPKLYDLATRLNCSRPQALGHLTLLWDFTADYAICGDIGRLPDGAIAGACDWTGNPAEFIEALVGSRWIDRDVRHRLLIHDWPDHCERWVKMKMDKLNLKFIAPSVEPSIERSTEASTERSIEGAKVPIGDTTEGTKLDLADSTERSPSRDRTEPNQTKPHSPPKRGERATELVEKIYQAYPRKVGKSDALKAIEKALKSVDGESLLRTVEAFAKSPAGQEGQFVPYPATWFNRGRWQDDPAEWNRAEAGGNAVNSSPPKPRCLTSDELKNLKQSDI